MTEVEVHTIKVPNPFVEGRNRVYVITEEPVTMIDSGIATRRGFDEIVTGLEQHGLEPRDIQRVILTHKHIDHIGNAWRIQQQSGAEIMIHESELHSVTDVDPNGDRHAAVIAQRLEEWDVPRDAWPSRTASSRPWEIEPAQATGLIDGQRVPVGSGHIEVMHTPGHTMGCICLRLGDRLFCGDHVLPDVSPNVGGGDMRSRNLLRNYLQSLTKLENMFRDEDVLALPGHGNPIATLVARCGQLIRHHEQRLDKLVTIVRTGEQTVYEIARGLFGDMKNFHVVLGCAEANAHLELLVEQGRIARAGSKFGPT